MISSSSMTRMELFIALVPATPHCRTDLRTRLTVSGLMDPGGRHRQGQPQRETRTLPGFTLARDGAPVLLHDPVRDRQAEPGALSDRLRGEERIVDPRQLL